MRQDFNGIFYFHFNAICGLMLCGNCVKHVEQEYLFLDFFISGCYGDHFIIFCCVLAC